VPVERPTVAFLEVDSRQTRGVVTIAVRGELDLDSAPILRSALDLALSSGPRRINLDLSELEFTGSIGVGVLVEANRRCDETGIALGIIPPTGQPMEVLEISGRAGELPLLREPVPSRSRSRRLLLVI
jgi:anti-anti-sigma factor